MDHIAFTNIGVGSSLQKVHYYENKNTYVDQNSGEFVEGSPYNDYKYFADLTADEAKAANTKVVRESGKALLTVSSTEDITETHNTGGIDYVVRTSVIGTIFEPKKKDAPPPNFKAAKLEDLIGDFKTFFAAINTFSDTLRGMAGDSSSALDGVIQLSLIHI